MLGNPPPGPMMDKTTRSFLALDEVTLPLGGAVLYLLPGPRGIEPVVHRGRLPQIKQPRMAPSLPLAFPYWHFLLSSPR